MNDYYAVLDLPPSATAEQLRTRYKLLIRIYHPDRFPNSTDKAYAEECLKAINEAYTVLGKSSRQGVPPEWDNPTPTATTQAPTTTARAVVPLGLLRRRVEQMLVAGGIVLAGLAATPLVVSPNGDLQQLWGTMRSAVEQPVSIDPSPRPSSSSPISADWVPILSPSGQRMVFVLRQAGVEKLYIRDANSGQLRAVLADAVRSHSLVWSPDENKLTFVTEENSGDRLYILDLQTGQTEQKADIAEVEH